MRPAGETPEQRVVRKAGEIRKALIEGNVVYSPDPGMPFVDLPEDRQSRWIKLAHAYIEVFG